jgi:hypothetical protein
MYRLVWLAVCAIASCVTAAYADGDSALSSYYPPGYVTVYQTVTSLQTRKIEEPYWEQEIYYDAYGRPYYHPVRYYRCRYVLEEVTEKIPVLLSRSLLQKVVPVPAVQVQNTPHAASK